MSSYPLSNPPGRWRCAELIRLDRRATRLQWWSVIIPAALLLGAVVVPEIGRQFSLRSDAAVLRGGGAFQPGIVIALTILTMLASTLMLSVSVRRLHDRNRSGWWVPLYLVPIIGQLWLLLELGLLRGTPGPNRFDP